jgi:hypothetical protein
VLLLPDDLGCNSPSNAPLVEDCCSCVILAELSACILIYGQAHGNPLIGKAINACKAKASGTNDQAALTRKLKTILIVRPNRTTR